MWRTGVAFSILAVIRGTRLVIFFYGEAELRAPHPLSKYYVMRVGFYSAPVDERAYNLQKVVTLKRFETEVTVAVQLINNPYIAADMSWEHRGTRGGRATGGHAWLLDGGGYDREIPP